MKYLFILLLLAGIKGFSQYKKYYTLSGRVTDEAGNGVVNAVIRASDNRDYFSDADGYFKIMRVSEECVYLSVVHSGYQKQSITIGKSRVINPVLQKDVKNTGIVIFLDSLIPPADLVTMQVDEEEDRIYNRVEISPRMEKDYTEHYFKEFIRQNNNDFRQEGEIQIRYTITDRGKVKDATIIKGISNVENNLLLDHLQKAKFQPAILNGRMISVTEDITFKFTGKKEKSETPANKDFENKRPFTPRISIRDTFVFPQDAMTAAIDRLIKEIDLAQVAKDFVLSMAEPENINTPLYDSIMARTSRTFIPGQLGYSYLKNYISQALRKKYTEQEINRLTGFYRTAEGKKSGLLNGMVFIELLKNLPFIMEKAALQK